MLIRTLPKLVFATAIAWLLIELLLVFPKLPARVATHFNVAGDANGWSSPLEFLGTIAFMVLLFAGLFAAVGQMYRLPNALINVPRKDYWLAPERRDATFAALRDVTRGFLAVVMCVLTFVMTSAMRANLVVPPHLSIDAGLLTAATLVPTLAMLGWMLWRFRVPTAAPR